MDFATLSSRQQAFFQSGATRSLAFRRRQLLSLAGALEQWSEPFAAALHKDLGKPAEEAYTSEIGYVAAEIRHVLRSLKSWMKPRRATTPPMAWPGKTQLIQQPRGRVLIIGAWNYPVQLTLMPLVAAIAAGNCAILKPSELAPETGKVLQAMIHAIFSDEFVAVCQGGREVAEELLRQPYGMIFYTGSAAVGSLVMAAAARTLTPVVLELGGKSPVVVCRDADVKTAARRIIWGKTINAGQTCVAPDYVLADLSVMADLIKEMKEAIVAFYGDDPQKSGNYGRIINQAHFDRIVRLLASGKIEAGGSFDAGERYVAPTILSGLNFDAPVMQEEIFGPILPVIGFESESDALTMLRRHPDPLALYVFSKGKATQQRFLNETSSGGVCFNDVILHMLGKDAPFGGIGASGMGAYHGKTGFDTFSHCRTVLRRPGGWETGFRFPPPKLSLQPLKRLLRLFFGR